MQEIRERRLVRGSDRVLGGVCSGLARYFSIDPLLVRLVFVLLALASGAGVVLYLLLWLLVPEAGEPPREGDVLGAGLRSVEADLRRLFGAPRSAFAAAPGTGGVPPAAPPPGSPAPRMRPVHDHGGLWLGTLLIVVGAVLLAGSAGMMTWWNWAVMWPVLIIALGVLLLARRLS